ncbi:hypothetical protein RIF29_21510 [Crotalaria pallida]|uniref:Uncharacterized protein n=1 Tax=Crotalaria pallida TaxID=3830 RepID=A0AAN9F6S5_CROPI
MMWIHRTYESKLGVIGKHLLNMSDFFVAKIMNLSKIKCLSGKLLLLKQPIYLDGTLEIVTIRMILWSLRKLSKM